MESRWFMVRKWSWLAAVALLAALVQPMAAEARAPLTPKDVSLAGVQEIGVLFFEALDDITAAYEDYLGDLQPVSTGVPLSKAFKVSAGASARIDKIAAAYTLKIEKTGTRYIARLIRMNAEPDLQGMVASARADAVAQLAAQQQVAQNTLMEALVDVINPM